MAVPAILAAAVSWILSAGAAGVVGNRADAGLMRLAGGLDPDFADRIARLASGASNVPIDRVAFSKWLGDQRTFDLLSRLAARPEASGDSGLHEFADEYASELLATAEDFQIIADDESVDAQTKVAELIACTLLALWEESDPVQRPLFILLGDTTALRQRQEKLLELVESLMKAVTASNGRAETVRSGTVDIEAQRRQRAELDAFLSRLERISDEIKNALDQSGSAHTAAALKQLPSGSRRTRLVYWATIQEIRKRTGILTGRQDELALIETFAAGDVGYRWLVGEPWAGKTALLAEAVATLPGNVDVVCYFLSRREADADSSRFLAAVIPQLASLLDEDPPAAELQQFRALWQRAADRAGAESRHLLLEGLIG